MILDELEFRRKYPDYPEWLVQVNIDRMKQTQTVRAGAKRAAAHGAAARFISPNGEFRRDDDEVGR